MHRRFLIIQTAFIGDVVLATALVEKLHMFFPGAEIDFMVRKGNEGLLKGHPKLRQVLVWDKRTDKYRNLFRLLRTVRANRYDVVVNLQRFAATGLLTVLSGAETTIGFSKNPWSRWFKKRVPHIVSTSAQPLHEIDRNQRLIAHLTDAVPAKPRLYPSATDVENVQAYKSSPYICIAPASVWFTKQYPVEKWISFVQKVPQDIRIYLLGAPGDHELAERIRLDGSGLQADSRTMEDRIINLCGKLGFLESVALQKDAMMNYVNDSAPMHFASAVNAPVTAVYCSTLPSFGFGPLSEVSHIVELREKLPCRPCGLHGRKACPEGHFKCAMGIDDTQLLGKITH